MKPYTYIVKHKPTGKLYYGYRGANKVSPHKDLWNKYFTSSKQILALVEQDGKDAFEYEIRKVFESMEDAVNWESKALRRLKVLHSDKWFNQNIAGYVMPTAESNKKISEYHMGKPKSEEHKRKLSESQKGKPKKSTAYQTDEYRKKMSLLKSGENNGRYGKPVSEETRAKIGAANKGRTPANKGVPMSDEQKAKISARNKGRKMSPESVARRAKKLQGQTREKKYCQHCDRHVAIGWYNRHGDNCKAKS